MRVVVLILEGVELLDMSGPVQAFDQARKEGAALRLITSGFTPSVRSSQGLSIADLAPPPDDLTHGDLVLVPGVAMKAFERMGPRDWASVTTWLRAASAAGAVVGSVCSGAFALGAAGLLDGRACTTHWSLVDRLAKKHPKARVLDDRLYVMDGAVVTSAGIASGLDLALAVIEERFGARLCSRVARELVAPIRRDGAAGQTSVFLLFRDHMRPGIHRVQDHLAQHLGERHTLAALATRARMSARTLTRAFREATGMSLKEYQTRLRVERCRELLAGSELTVDEIAERLGFADVRQLRRMWRAATGTALRVRSAPVT